MEIHIIKTEIEYEATLQIIDTLLDAKENSERNHSRARHKLIISYS
jgi:hypothetical protein